MHEEIEVEALQEVRGRVGKERGDGKETGRQTFAGRFQWRLRGSGGDRRRRKGGQLYGDGYLR